MAVSESIASVMQFEIKRVDVECIGEIDTMVDDTDAAIVVAGIGGGYSVQRYLNAFRSLRIPYLFVKQHNTSFAPQRIILPVTNLMEDREKGPYASSFARHYYAPITIVKPRDYGSQAQANIDAMITLFDSLSVRHEVQNARRDSSKVEREALKFSNPDTPELLIISASRDYGLDDIIFGPKERSTIRHSAMPVLVINPRADLYPLCD